MLMVWDAEKQQGVAKLPLAFNWHTYIDQLKRVQAEYKDTSCVNGL